jgi:serine/threonine-protein kinase HipA
MDGHDDGLGESAPYGRIEYAYALMAARAGIEMTECRLLAEGPRRHFMTRRFDRLPEGVRLHVASLCALRSLDFNLVATHSYDQYLQAVLALELGPDALREAFRRMAFNVAAVNRDDHTKNFAFLCDRSGTWSLAPAFDVTHAYRADSHWTSRHFLSVNGRFEGITIADLHEVGERNGVSGYRNVVRDVLAATADFSEFAALGDVPEEVAARIVDDLARFRPA